MNDTTTDPRAEWVAAAGDGLPLDAPSVFPETKGFFVARANKARAKLLSKLRTVLLTALQPGEGVRYVAQGCQYFASEFALSGYWVAYQSNITALVLTSERLLLIQIKSSGVPRDIKNQVRLSEIQSSKKSYGSRWEARLANGKKLVFLGMKRADVKVFASAFPKQPKAPATNTPSIEHLCPSCLRVVPGKVGDALSCPNETCRIPFRDPRRAARLSALVPGVGDLYLRHHLFGAMEFIGSIVTLAVACYFGMVAVFSGEAEDLVASGVLAGLFVLVPRVFDYFLTLHMGRKGLVPLALKATAAHEAAMLPSFPRWAYALFAAGGLGLVLGLGAAAPAARSDSAVAQARASARAGNLDEAWERWNRVVASGQVSTSDRARFALALYQAGDLTGGDKLVEQLGEVEVEQELANDLNKAINEASAAGTAYNDARQALVMGEEAKAWPQFDQALAYYARVKRPVFPKTRPEAVAWLAADLLAPVAEEGDVQRADELLASVAKEAPTDQVAIARARIWAYRGQADKARAALGELKDPSLVPARWWVLALETRADIARDEAERAAISAEARKLPTTPLDPQDIERVKHLVEGPREGTAATDDP